MSKLLTRQIEQQANAADQAKQSPTGANVGTSTPSTVLALTNDQLRQIWMESTVPLCEGIGVEVPAHWDDEKKEFALEYPFPCQYDHTVKKWLSDEPLTWDQVFDRWKARGPMNERYVEMIQGDFGRRHAA